MPASIVINGRFQHRVITGVDRYAHEISKRLSHSQLIAPQHPLNQISGHLWEQLILPLRIPHGQMLWSPANAGPWAVQNQIITLHDASIFDHPEWFKPVFGAWSRLSWKILAQRVKGIITVSNFSRDRLMIHLGISKEKIHIIPNGVGKPFKPQSQKSIAGAKEKYNIKNPYFLFVGTHDPRKNLAGLIQAWENLDLRSHSLFIAGGVGKIFSNKNRFKNDPLPIHVSDEELPALYSGAVAVIVPSFYEGFGLTVLESMACGVPVIAADIPVFRELFEGAAFFTNPHQPNEIANAMQRIIEEKSLAMTLRENGLAHAAKFSWDVAAHQTQEAIHYFGTT